MGARIICEGRKTKQLQGTNVSTDVEWPVIDSVMITAEISIALCNRRSKTGDAKWPMEMLIGSRKVA